MRISDWSSDVCSSNLSLTHASARRSAGSRSRECLPVSGRGKHALAIRTRAWHKRDADRSGAGQPCSGRVLGGRVSRHRAPAHSTERKSVGEGKGESVRVGLGGRRCLKKKKKYTRGK